MTSPDAQARLKREAIPVPPEAQEAWADYDPPEFKHPGAAIRDAFYAGWLSRTPDAQPSSTEGEVERVARAICEAAQAGMDEPVDWADAHENYKDARRREARAAIAAQVTKP